MAANSTTSSASPLSVRAYLFIWLALMLLLGLTVFAARYDLGVLGLLIALGIAAAKAALVVLYFMHLRFSNRVTWVFAGAGVFFLGILFVLASQDYLTRGWLPRSEQITEYHSWPPPPPGVSRAPRESPKPILFNNPPALNSSHN